MATTAEPQLDANRPLITGLSQWADPLSKGVAAIAVAVYACGFLIVSLHNSTYGFMATNPFRPRILAAGAWFFLLSALPLPSVMRLKDYEPSWLGLAYWLYADYFGCLLMSLVASPFISYSDYSSWPGPLSQRWLWLLATIVLLVFVFCFRFVFRNSKKSTRIMFATASVLLVLFCLLYSAQTLLIAHRFGPSAVAMWFFVVLLLAISKLKNPSLGRSWENSVLLLLGALLVFALFYYPHIKASWGGGTPVSVTVYFTKESPISPNKAVSAQLIEESDAGFYIVGPNDTKAIYVPRSAVALVYFSDKVSDSAILRDNK